MKRILTVFLGVTTTCSTIAAEEPPGNKVTSLELKIGRITEGIALFSTTVSPDRKRIAFFRRSAEGEKWWLVVDNTAREQYDAGGKADRAFSPDSQRLGYVVKRGVKWLAIVDGKGGKEYDGAGGLIFSVGSKSWAHMAVQAGKSLVVLDGLDSEPYDDFLRETALVFPSPYMVDRSCIGTGRSSASRSAIS